MNAPRVKSVEPLRERRLLVTFVNGMQKIYDCKGIMHLDRFRSLKNEAFFKTVTVDPGGYGVSWNDETDLSEYELWNNGIEVGTASESVHSRDIPQGQVVGKEGRVFVPQDAANIG
jgi:hypothetical protein